MAGAHSADVVFVLDASGSMEPLFDGMRRNLNAFVEGLSEGHGAVQDIRLDFLAHNGDETKFHASTIGYDSCLDVIKHLYKNNNDSKRFFTNSPKVFTDRLGAVKCAGDETGLYALDLALDFPWRPAQKTRRAIVYITDEPLETGSQVDILASKIPDLIEKIHARRVKLYIVAPSSSAYNQLAEADGSDYDVIEENNGLSKIDFADLLRTMGKSVSASTLQSGADDEKMRDLYGMKSWVSVDGPIHGV